MKATVKRTSRRLSPGVENAIVVETDPQAFRALVFDREPTQLTENDFRHLLMSAVLSGASDITIQSDQQPRAEINRTLYRLMRRTLSQSEVDRILSEVYGGTNGPTEIKAQSVLDFSYELNLEAGRQRFRVNAVGIHARDGAGTEITFRALPAETPTMSKVGLDDDLAEALTPEDGIVVIAGATGSGKSTTMAAINRRHLEDTERPVKIVDIQAPVEYTFRDVMSRLDGSSSMIGQSEVGRHIPSFAAGVRSALRRKPNIINVGEARDFETIQASLEASLTGHLVYTTTHAGSAADAIRRLLSTFPGQERESRAYDLLSALRFLMVQHLVTTADKKGVVAVREYIEITQEIRERLGDLPISEWTGIITKAVQGTASLGNPRRRSLTESCRELYAAGRISRHDALRLGGLSALDDQGGA